MSEPEAGERGGDRPPTIHRLECRCAGDRSVLLATYDDAGEIRIKVRDRYLFIHGRLRAICPRCGVEHVLDLRDRAGSPSAPVPEPSSAPS